MAYVNWDQIQDVDHSKPYKTFNDLETNDEIYEIDFINLKLIPLNIEIFEKKKSSYGIHDLNRYEVSFKIINEENSISRIDDGNQYIDRPCINYKERFLCTDKRIGESIINILRYRNTYQWETITGLFGNPLGKYTVQDVKLC